VGLQHVVTKHRAEIGGQRVETVRLEQVERLAVDLDDADAARALCDPLGMLAEMRAQIGDALGAPCVEQRAHAAEVLEPE
jgi:hypothetical protein